MGPGSWVLGAVLLAACLLMPVPVAAQHAEHQPPVAADRVMGVEPIRCWRQASAGAVTIGEPFSVVLTCAVYESADAQVVPDESRLNVASIQMAPFEILGGGHPPDVRRGSRRFFQYDYQLRIISPDAIGRDVNVPGLTISYRIHSRVGAAAKLEGRDLSYLLPPMPIKVLSLVPAEADDIRDGAAASLAAVDALRFRSSLFEVIALALGALAVVMVVIALPLSRRSRAAASAGSNRLPDRAVLANAAGELAGIQARATRDGWTDETVAAALAACRVVAATAIDQPVSQKPLPAGGAVPEGRLLVRHGRLRPVRVTVSSPVTADDVARAASRAAMTTTRRHQLGGLQSAIATLTAALYRRSAGREAPALDEAVRHAISVAREVAAERNWWRQGVPWARR